MKRSYAIDFVVTDIAQYGIILGLAWLQNQNLDIH
jgi:hypothetical protein